RTLHRREAVIEYMDNEGIMNGNVGDGFHAVPLSKQRADMTWSPGWPACYRLRRRSGLFRWSRVYHTMATTRTSCSPKPLQACKRLDSATIPGYCAIPTSSFALGVSGRVRSPKVRGANQLWHR